MSDIRQALESKRYKKDYKLDGWPIADTEARSILGTDDLVVILNEYEAAHKAQQAEIVRLTKLITKSLGLLDVALCPSCDNSGAYYDNYGEVTQCQWCHEVNEIKSALEGNQ